MGKPRCSMMARFSKGSVRLVAVSSVGRSSKVSASRWLKPMRLRNSVSSVSIAFSSMIQFPDSILRARALTASMKDAIRNSIYLIILR